MGKGYKHGASGGVSPLNFYVKTYPSETELKADTPKENTIGVCTTTTMNSWVFSSTEPKEPEVGMVWFAVGKESIVEFNALKKNTLQVYPFSAKQYVSSVWQDVTAMSYLDGEWVEWIPPGALYWRGDQRTDLTGGWAIRNTNGSNLNPPTCTFEETSIKITSASGSKSGVLSTTNKIDLTKAKTLTVDIVNKTNTYIVLYVGSAKNDNEGAVASKTVSATGVFDLDVSSVSGAYYVGFYIRTDAAIDADISEVYYE